MSRAAFHSSALAVLGLLCLPGGAALGAIFNGNLVTIGRWSNNNTANDSSEDEYLNDDPTYGGSLSGGEFRITKVSGGEVFKTFCLEYNEFIAINGTKYVATINDGAILGGVSGGGSTNGYYDPIGGATKWLYRAYRTSSLDDFTDFEYDDPTWGDALQLVFWRLEGEATPAGADVWRYTPDNGLIAQAAQKLWDFYLQYQGTLESYEDDSVQVLNLWKNTVDDAGKPFSNTANYDLLDQDTAAAATFRGSLEGYKQQSQLYYSGPANVGPVLPEPASLAAWGTLGLLGFVASRRRRAARPPA